MSSTSSNDRGLLDERLHAPERGRDGGELTRVERARRDVEVCAKDEAHDAAEAGHQALRNRVVGMGREARIEDPLDLGLLLEPARDLEPGLVLACHAQRERLERVRRSAQPIACDGLS